MPVNERPHKAHHASEHGAKVEKKGKGKASNLGYNEKAFAPKSGRKADQQGRRNVEREQTRLHVPLINRTPDDEPPPIIIAIVGPPGVGKTTLIKSLVRRYSKHTLNEVKGPITVVSGKKRRLTFVECNNDINSMIDIGKIADLVLLMIDGSYGFEMETFEFLNILQVHGFPKIIGVLTHLDLIKKQATLRDSKRALKKRFWTDVYQGAKLFYLSGVLNGRYPDIEIQNLARFVSVMKFRPLVFRNSHPYVLADRLEDMTPRQDINVNPKMDRRITMYGYLRGTNLREGGSVHIPGVGDMRINSIKQLSDPCPLPTADSERRRKLADKARLIHAPMSDIGGVSYDKDAVYINVPGNFSKDIDDAGGEGERMVMQLQDVKEGLAERIKNSEIKLFSDSQVPLDENLDFGSSDEEVEEYATDSESGDSEDGLLQEKESDDSDNIRGSNHPHQEGNDTGRSVPRRPGRATETIKSSARSGEVVEFEDSDSDADLIGDEIYEEEEEAEAAHDDSDAPRWKSHLKLKALDRVASYPSRNNWMDLIYSTDLDGQGMRNVVSGAEEQSKQSDQMDVDGFFTVKKTQFISGHDTSDQCKESFVSNIAEDWEEEALDTFRSFFFTGVTRDDDQAVDESGLPYEDNEGGFEDLEGSSGDHLNGKLPIPIITPAADTVVTYGSDLAAKKEALKKKFDLQYDDADEEQISSKDLFTVTKDEMAKQRALNEAELVDLNEEARVLIEGYRVGSYLRVEICDAPSELVDNFDPCYPLLLGGLQSVEERFGLIQVRLKRHRWFTRTLKTNDPLIFSLGWRRFQSIPIYSLDDHSIRMRMLKYTPEHMHCYATFYGPLTQPNTAFCAFNSLDNSTTGFRVSATGVVLDLDRSAKIVKKLKLTGTAYKIFKNTAFIKDMFSSAIEVAKFEGAQIRTVSGVRGQVKKALGKPDGAFRAAFEDKVLMSDMIFLRAWTSIEPREFYNPVASLLLADKQWTGMRLTGQVRRAEGLKTPLNAESTYKQIERPARRFNPLKIPQKLQAGLPYSVKPRQMKPQRQQTYIQKRAVVMEPEEKRTVAVMQQMRALRKDQMGRRKERKVSKNEEHKKKVVREEERKGEQNKSKRKEYMRALGMKSKREEEHENGSSRRHKKSRH